MPQKSRPDGELLKKNPKKQLYTKHSGTPTVCATAECRHWCHVVAVGRPFWLTGVENLRGVKQMSELNIKPF